MKHIVKRVPWAMQHSNLNMHVDVTSVFTLPGIPLHHSAAIILLPFLLLFFPYSLYLDRRTSLRSAAAHLAAPLLPPHHCTGRVALPRSAWELPPSPSGRAGVPHFTSLSLSLRLRSHRSRLRRRRDLVSGVLTVLMMWKKHLASWNSKERKFPAIGKPLLVTTTLEDGLLKNLPTAHQAQARRLQKAESPAAATPPTSAKYMKELPPLDL